VDPVTAGEFRAVSAALLVGTAARAGAAPEAGGAADVLRRAVAIRAVTHGEPVEARHEFAAGRTGRRSAKAGVVALAGGVIAQLTVDAALVAAERAFTAHAVAAYRVRRTAVRTAHGIVGRTAQRLRRVGARAARGAARLSAARRILRTTEVAAAMRAAFATDIVAATRVAVGATERAVRTGTSRRVARRAARARLTDADRIAGAALRSAAGIARVTTVAGAANGLHAPGAGYPTTER